MNHEFVHQVLLEGDAVVLIPQGEPQAALELQDDRPQPAGPYGQVEIIGAHPVAQARQLQQLIELERAMFDMRGSAYITLLQQVQAEEARAAALRASTQAAVETTRTLDRMTTAINAPQGFRLVAVLDAAPELIGTMVGELTVAHLDTVPHIVAQAEAVHDERRQEAEHHAELLGWVVPDVVDVATVVEMSDYADACQAGLVDASRTVIAGAVETLTREFGGKAGLLAAAKAAADDLGLARPRSCDAISDQPRLVARLAVTDPPPAASDAA
jgi:hypothetical protein